MLPFLAFLVPGAITAGVAAYKYFNDSDSDTSSTSPSSSTLSQSNSDKNILQEEIKNYQISQQKRLKDKYGVDIVFNTTKQSAFLRSSIIAAATMSSYDMHQNLYKEQTNSPFSVGQLGIKGIFSNSTMTVIGNNDTNNIDNTIMLESEVEELTKLLGELEVMQLKNKVEEIKLLAHRR